MRSGGSRNVAPKDERIVGDCLDFVVGLLRLFGRRKTALEAMDALKASDVESTIPQVNEDISEETAKEFQFRLFMGIPAEGRFIMF